MHICPPVCDLAGIVNCLPKGKRHLLYSVSCASKLKLIKGLATAKTARLIRLQQSSRDKWERSRIHRDYRTTMDPVALFGQKNFNHSAVTCLKKRVSSSRRSRRLKMRPNELSPRHRLLQQRSCDPGRPNPRDVRKHEGTINLCMGRRYSRARARSSRWYLNGASVIGKISNKRFETPSIRLRWIPKMLSSTRARVTYLLGTVSVLTSFYHRGQRG